MTAEEVVTARRLLKLKTRMRVRHPDYGTVEVSAYSKEQAECMAANIWGVAWTSVEDRLRVSVLMESEAAGA